MLHEDYGVAKNALIVFTNHDSEGGMVSHGVIVKVEGMRSCDALADCAMATFSTNERDARWAYVSVSQMLKIMTIMLPNVVSCSS